MNHAVIYCKSAKRADAVALSAVLPDLAIEELQHRLLRELPLVALDFEGPNRVASVQLFYRLAELFRMREMEVRIHQLVEVGEDPGDPSTLIDLELMENALDSPDRAVG